MSVVIYPIKIEKSFKMGGETLTLYKIAVKLVVAGGVVENRHSADERT